MVNAGTRRCSEARPPLPALSKPSLKQQPASLGCQGSRLTLPVRRTHLFLLLAEAEARGPLLHHYTRDASGARPSCAAHDYVYVSFAATTDEGLWSRRGKTAGPPVMGQWEGKGSGKGSQDAVPRPQKVWIQDGPNWAQTRGETARVNTGK